MALGNVLNEDFSIAGAADGQAADWTEAYPGDGAGTAVTVEEVACFTHSVLDEPQEGFEDSWFSNQLAIASLSVGTSITAMFEWQMGYLPYAGSLGYENFETSWALPSVLIPSDPRFNHQSIYDYSSGSFTSAGIDTLETGWDSNQNSVANLLAATTSAASFDVGVIEPVEDFEEEWHDNENFVASYQVATTVAATWDTAGLDTDEDFENQWTTTYP